MDGPCIANQDEVCTILVVTWTCQSGYMDLSKLLHIFVKVITCVCQVLACISCPLPNQTKLKFDKDFKACWIYWFWYPTKLTLFVEFTTRNLIQNFVFLSKILGELSDDETEVWTVFVEWGKTLKWVKKNSMPLAHKFKKRWFGPCGPRASNNVSM